MKAKKIEIDYSNFDSDKEYNIKNEKVKLSNNKLIASVNNLLNYRRPDLGGKKQLGNSNVDKWAKENPEEHKQTSTLGGKLGGKKSKELAIGIHGLSDTEKKLNASKGGMSNSIEEMKRKRSLVKTQGTPPKTPINVYDFKTNEFIKEYPSISECSRDMNLDKGNIHKVCNNVYAQYKGYKFEKVKLK